MTEKNWKLLNGLALAYMGDGIYEVYVRNHVLQKGLTKPNQLHATATKFVSAKAQARLMQQMLEQENFLNEEELEILKQETTATVFEDFLTKVEEVEEFTADNIKALIKAIQKDTGVKGKNLFMPIRIASTGSMHGPELNTSLELLGKERVASRVKAALETIK